MIYFYKGAKGRGKTLSMVKDAYLFHRDGKKVYSNMKSLTFGEFISNEQILNLDKNSKLEKCVLLIDELQTLFNARRSMKKENVNFSHFIQQIRKRGIELLASTQYTNTVDLTFRQHVDYICVPKYDKETFVCEVLYIDLNSIEDNETGGIGEPKQCKVCFDAQLIFGMYDTEELIV